MLSAPRSARYNDVGLLKEASPVNVPLAEMIDVGTTHEAGRRSCACFEGLT
jgi:hypothetical protein